MMEFVLGALIFACGTTVGLIAGAFITTIREADEFEKDLAAWRDEAPAYTTVTSKYLMKDGE